MDHREKNIRNSKDFSLKTKTRKTIESAKLANEWKQQRMFYQIKLKINTKSKKKSRRILDFFMPQGKEEDLKN